MSQEYDNLAEQNQRLMREIQRSIDQLLALGRVTSAVSQAFALDTVFQIALDAVLNVVRAGPATISLVDESAGELVVQAQQGGENSSAAVPSRIPLSAGVWGEAFVRDEVIIADLKPGDPLLAVLAPKGEQAQMAAMIPIHARGRVAGILSVTSGSPKDFDRGLLSVLGSIADQVGVAWDNARLAENSRVQSDRLRVVLDATGDAVIVTDGDGNVSLVNASAEAFFDLPTSQIIGTPLGHAPLYPRLADELRDVLSANRHGNAAFEVALEDGRTLSVIVAPIAPRESLGQPPASPGWAIAIRDVTLLRQAEQSRIDFIHTAAHDLRNPLGVTLGALSMLQRDLSEISDLHREVIDIGLQGVNRMQELIDNVLNLEHIDSGVGLRYREVDVRELLERGISDIQPALQQREQTLHVAVPAFLPAVVGDMHWLYRALLNLLANATKYTQVGGDITLRSFVQDDALFIEVEDNGPGISPDVLPHIFERFYRGPMSDQRTSGAGLGLAIVRSVVEQHGGQVNVFSYVGQGSTFRMAFPLSDRGPRRGGHSAARDPHVE